MRRNTKCAYGIWNARVIIIITFIRQIFLWDAASFLFCANKIITHAKAPRKLVITQAIICLSMLTNNKNEIKMEIVGVM